MLQTSCTTTDLGASWPDLPSIFLVHGAHSGDRTEHEEDHCHDAYAPARSWGMLVSISWCTLSRRTCISNLYNARFCTMIL
ncbi:hypothetical protein JG687_00005020 [Phytophthora cactorum]|uniref:Uncharacterized protein n=1 Tax=Phytophthora cactorum TaxID=29920 RepID=A0A8T1URM4_9STRA|nr:hypothetical protein JG687_00005020 [Phytophthora cactorum]